MTRAGGGVPKDDQQALGWYRKAAEQGLANAQYNLGVMYEDGRGVPKDDQQALGWYRKAAEQGLASAQFNLGLIYVSGQGVPKDEQSAYFWWLLASAQGQQNAVKNRDLMSRRLSSAQRAAAQASARSWQAASPPAAPIVQATPAQKTHFDDVDFNYVTKTTPPPAPATKKLGPIDRWQYESCQKEASFAPTAQGVNVGLRLCREKFGQ